MRFLVDECAGPRVAEWLRQEGHDVFSVYEQARGADDVELIQRAYAENRIIVTADKDFGDMVYREHYPHHGVILMRLENDRAYAKIDALRRLLESYSDQLPDQFVVLTESRVRFGRR